MKSKNHIQLNTKKTQKLEQKQKKKLLENGEKNLKNFLCALTFCNYIFSIMLVRDRERESWDVGCCSIFRPKVEMKNSTLHSVLSQYIFFFIGGGARIKV